MPTQHSSQELWPHHLHRAVCLSILGTWSGESEDEWRSSYSINYVLSAIQSLIMTAKPYHNEPGYEEVTRLLLLPLLTAEVQC